MGEGVGQRVGDDVEIVRGMLCQILREQVPDVEILFNDSIEAIDQSSDGVRVQFRNQKAPRMFDLVIGADGLHSNVRRLIFGEEARFLKHLGLYISVFTIPNYLNLDRLEMFCMESGKSAMIWHSRGEETAKVGFSFSASPDDVGNLRDKLQQQQTLRNFFQGMGWEVDKFLQLMPDSPDFYFDSVAQILMEQWSKERVVLLGDAGYCASPMSGQGTSLALVGAYVLAGELANGNGNYTRAFERYQNEMGPYVELNQAVGVRSAKLIKGEQNKNIFSLFLKLLTYLMPGSLLKWVLTHTTKRIAKAANAILLKDYYTKSL